MKKLTGIPKGFTLVELMIVIALIAIMTSFAVPAWQHYSINTNLKNASREIMADILNTRQRAIAENLNTYRLTFDTVAHNYSLTRTDTGATLWTRSLDSFGGKNEFNNVSLSGGSFINFQRRGTLTDGTITLKNEINSTATITLTMLGRAYAEYNLQK
jgi:prepilin-type N-terminal cleavage/methylation domain-containing protein